MNKQVADKKLSNKKTALILGSLALICYVVSMFAIWQN